MRISETTSRAVPSTSPATSAPPDQSAHVGARAAHEALALDAAGDREVRARALSGVRQREPVARARARASSRASAGWPSDPGQARRPGDRDPHRPQRRQRRAAHRQLQHAARAPRCPRARWPGAQSAHRRGPICAMPKRPPMWRPPSTTRSSRPGLVDAQDGALGLDRQQRPRQRVGRHLAVLGLEAHGVAERDQERLLPPGVVDGAQGIAEQLPAARDRRPGRCPSAARSSPPRGPARARAASRGGACAGARRARPGTGSRARRRRRTPCSRARCAGRSARGARVPSPRTRRRSPRRRSARGRARSCRPTSPPPRAPPRRARPARRRSRRARCAARRTPRTASCTTAARPSRRGADRRAGAVRCAGSAR